MSAAQQTRPWKVSTSEGDVYFDALDEADARRQFKSWELPGEAITVQPATAGDLTGLQLALSSANSLLAQYRAGQEPDTGD